MAADAFICTNLVNYSIARRGLLAASGRTGIVFYERWRFIPERAAHIWHLPINVWTMRLLSLLVALRVVGKLYVPHQRLNRRATAVARRASALAFIDDGLDTRRAEPRNFDLPLDMPGIGYFTFRDYRVFPEWLHVLRVQQVCDLRDLALMSHRPKLPLEGVDHILVESPGLDIGQVVAALALPSERTLVVRHPVPHKRGKVPVACSSLEGTEVNVEATLLQAEGKSFYFGETMSLVFAACLGAATRNRVYAQLSSSQRSNLIDLPLQEVGTVPGLLQLLPDSVAGSRAISGQSATITRLRAQ